jgi:hypothetical protein
MRRCTCRCCRSPLPRRYRALVLAQPAQSSTDFLLGVVAVALALKLRRTPDISDHWRTAFFWFGAAALAGALYHGTIVRSPRAAEVSWAVISVMVVVAVSYLLAATVAEVLGPGRARAFWLLRSVGLAAYVVLAASGRAGIGSILACESLTMLSVLVLWIWAARRGHPLAPATLLAIAASIAAAAVKLPNADLLRSAGLDPDSAYHLAQLGGIALLYLAVSGNRAEAWGERLPHGAAGIR